MVGFSCRRSEPRSRDGSWCATMRVDGIVRLEDGSWSWELVDLRDGLFY